MKIITGNPGTGKHTIAKILAKKLKLSIIDVNKVALDEGVLEKVDDALVVDVVKLKKILPKQILDKSLLVGHLAPYVVPKNKVEAAIVLRRSPYELQSIYKKRRYSHKKLIENLGSEILGITYYDTIKNIGSDKTYQIDTSCKSISAITKKIERLFLTGKIKEDKVDWLALVTKKGHLMRFFPY